MFFMLAGRDDYTPAPLAIDYAERMRAAGNDRIKVKVYGSAHHGWESIGPVFDIRDAENWSCCKNFIEDDGSHFVVAAGRAMSEPDYQAWARQHCVTRGARAGGGTAELKTARDGGSAGVPACPRLRAWQWTANSAIRGDSVLGVIAPVANSSPLFWRFVAFLAPSEVSPSSANETLWDGSRRRQGRARRPC